MRLTTDKAQARIDRRIGVWYTDCTWRSSAALTSGYRQAADTGDYVHVTIRNHSVQVTFFNPENAAKCDDAALWQEVDRWYRDADYRMETERMMMEHGNAESVAGGLAPPYSEADILAACEALCDIVLIGYVAVEEETAP